MLRVAVIGIGRMGGRHAANLKKGRVSGARLSAVCDINPDAISAFVTKHGEVQSFSSYRQLIDEGRPDAVIIATPHYAHGEIAVYAIEHEVHVLVEKPLTVTTAEAKRVIAAASAHPRLTCAVMFNQRTNPLYRAAREFVANGTIGSIQRLNYIITDWYRSQAYYDQGGWRASLRGEGGGTLINQCVHQLDLIQWIAGMPKSIYARAYTVGRQITTENDVTALFNYGGSVHCSFSASTHELRGTNRMEIAGTKGRIVVDKRKLTLYTFAKSEDEVNASTKNGYGIVARRKKVKRYGLKFLKDLMYGQQINIVRNFVAAILKQETLISPLSDGLNAVELINGAYLSAWTGGEVSLPIDDNEYLILLETKIAEEVAE